MVFNLTIIFKNNKYFISLFWNLLNLFPKIKYGRLCKDWNDFAADLDIYLGNQFLF